MLHLLVPAFLLLGLLVYLLKADARWGLLNEPLFGPLITMLAFESDDSLMMMGVLLKRHQLLPSPGPTIPLLGHFHYLLTGWVFIFQPDSWVVWEAPNLQDNDDLLLNCTFRNGIKDPVNRLWDLYKRHNRGGLLRIRAFNIELVGIILNTSRAFSSLKVYIGDFKMLKEVFNNPDAQGRAIPQIHEVRYCVLCM